ncbi:UNVERIFIED_CONTAM: hypothetical protein FKN15_063256 [Acipenser sinensis]
MEVINDVGLYGTVLDAVLLVYKRHLGKHNVNVSKAKEIVREVKVLIQATSCPSSSFEDRSKMLWDGEGSVMALLNRNLIGVVTGKTSTSFPVVTRPSPLRLCSPVFVFLDTLENLNSPKKTRLTALAEDIRKLQKLDTYIKNANIGSGYMDYRTATKQAELLKAELINFVSLYLDGILQNKVC